MAGASLVGQHMGADDNTQAKRSAWSGMRLSIGFMTILPLMLTTNLCFHILVHLCGNK